MINQLLQAELQGGVHALSIVVSNGCYSIYKLISLLAREKNYALFRMGQVKNLYYRYVVIYVIVLSSRRKHQSNGRQAIQ